MDKKELIKKRVLMFLIKFGKNVKRLREERNMTIKELADITKISEKFLNKIEKGEARRMKFDYVLILAKAFKVELCEMLKGV